MKTIASKISFTFWSLALLWGMMILLWGCIKNSTITPDAKVSLSYIVSIPESEEVIASGEQKDVLLHFTGSALFELLSGAKKGEIRSGILQDPLLQHEANKEKKQPTIVLQEIGIPLTVGESIHLDKEEYIITNIISENGVEQAVLDSNPRETIFPMHWEITIKEIH